MTKLEQQSKKRREDKIKEFRKEIKTLKEENEKIDLYLNDYQNEIEKTKKAIEKLREEGSIANDVQETKKSVEEYITKCVSKKRVKETRELEELTFGAIVEALEICEKHIKGFNFETIQNKPSYKNFKLNGRLSRALGRIILKGVKNRNGINETKRGIVIEINKTMVQNILKGIYKRQLLVDVIVHELIHSQKGCIGHGTEFQRKIKEVKKATNNELMGLTYTDTDLYFN
jgi:hypothetical protein